jgi:DNA-binding beta-propeller fold protein YncE
MWLTLAGLLATNSLHAQSPVEIVLTNDVDEPRGYCIDIPGFQSEAKPAEGLQIHTCYSYRGSLGVDQAFDADGMAEGIFRVIAYDLCMTAQSDPGDRSLSLERCDGRDTQRFERRVDGRIISLAMPDYCITAAVGPSRTGGGGDPVHLYRALNLEGCDGGADDRQRWRLRLLVSDINNVTGSNGLIMIDKRAGLVRFFDPKTLQEISSLDLGVGPHELAISPDHKTAYVPKFGDGIYDDNPNPGNSIVVIDLESREIRGRIDVSPYLAPHGLQVDKSGMLYATVEMSRKMLIIDPETKSIEAAIDTDGAGHWIIVLPDGSKAYVANKDDRRFISVIDLKSRRMIGKVPMPNGTQGITLSPDGKQVLAIDYKEPRFYVIDTVGDAVIDTIDIADNSIGPFRIRFSPSGDRLITVNDEDSLANIYDGHDLSRPPQSVAVGEQPFGIAYSADGSVALISNHGDGTISVIDLDEMRVVETLKAGTGIETLSFY